MTKKMTDLGWLSGAETSLDNKDKAVLYAAEKIKEG